MGILTRFKDIMSANINAMLDKCEDPEKMIDQYMRNLQEELGQVKAETASVIADKSKAERDLNNCKSEVDKLQGYAEKALKSGNEADARTFLSQKQAQEKQLEALQITYNTAVANADKMTQMYNKLVKDISELEARRGTIKAKVRAAEAQKKINDIGHSMTGATTSLDSFKRMEEKADHMLDEANAMSELDSSSASASVEDLKSKYDDPQTADASVDDELAAMKAKLGL